MGAVNATMEAGTSASATARGAWDVQLAAAHIQDALDGIERPHPRRGARRAHLGHLLLRVPVRLVLVLNVLLCFFDTPDWTRDSSANITDPNGMYPRFDLPMLTDGPATALAAAALALLVIDLALQVAFQGPAAFCSRGLQVAYAVTVVLAALELTLSPWLPMRFAPYLRLLLLVLQSEHVLVQLRLIGRCLPALLPVAAAMGAFVVFSAWLGLVMFEGTAEGHEVMPSLAVAVWELLVCLTSANFPDVMMPAYADSRWSVLFFALYLILAHWFLLNLVLGVVYKAHADLSLIHISEPTRPY